MHTKLKTTTIQFLTISLILLFILTAGVFSFLAVYMNQRSAETIGEVGKIYMDGMSERISLHFATTIDLRLKQVEALVQTHAPDSASPDELRDDLIYSAQARGFDYLGLYSESGKYVPLYGGELEVTDQEPQEQAERLKAENYDLQNKVLAAQSRDNAQGDATDGEGSCEE